MRVIDADTKVNDNDIYIDFVTVDFVTVYVRKNEGISWLSKIGI